MKDQPLPLGHLKDCLNELIALCLIEGDEELANELRSIRFAVAESVRNYLDSKSDPPSTDNFGIYPFE
jgi:hypothetical protein